MNAYRLETFSPSSSPGTNHPEGCTLRQLEAACGEAYRNGFAAGQSCAMEACLEDESRLTSELVEALADTRLTNEAARRHVAKSVAPVIEALVAGVSPALARAGLAPEVVSLVQRALARAPKVKPRLRCAPELATRIGRLLNERGLDADVEEGPELLPCEAKVYWDQGYDHLDLDACIAEMRTCVELHLEKGSLSKDDDPRKFG